MRSQRSTASGVGLERSCSGATDDWLRSTGPENGVEVLEAWLHGPAYHPHRHDTYAIGLTTCGVQAFTYRGVREISLPGQVVVLHPDELHDGHAGTDAGFGYRQLYVEPALIFEAVQMLRGQARALPFVRRPVLLSPCLSNAVTCAFADGHASLAMDSVVVQVAEGLLAADSSCSQVPLPRHLDIAALQRARAFLDAEKTRVVHSAELEAVTGLSRYALARQFRVRYGTSPYRYLLMRRLEEVRQQIARGRALVDAALDAGFADQAHCTRMFTATFGVTPARYRALCLPTTSS
jgi:prepilin-type processing-associated H-X9-DG protein